MFSVKPALLPKNSPVFRILRYLFGPLTSNPLIRRIIGDNRPRPIRRGPPPRVSENYLKKRAAKLGITPGPQDFVLYRILGNDIPLRHSRHQTITNLNYLLHNESDFPHCQKIWVINRIADTQVAAEVKALLDKHEQPYIHIPYDQYSFLDQPLDLQGLPKPGLTCSAKFTSLPEDYKHRVYLRVLRHRSNYLIHNNGARNAALEQGKTLARWILPWDGNCCLTEQGWTELSSAIQERPWYPYVIVPMARLNSLDQLI